MRAFIWTLLAAAAIAGVVWLFAARPASEGGARAPSAGQAQGLGAPAGLVDPAPRAASEAQSTPPSTQPSATPQAGSALAARAPDASTAAPDAPASRVGRWEQRYSGQTSAQLMGRVRALHQSVEVEAAGFFQRERDAGRYRALPIARDAQGRPTNPLLALGATDMIRHVFVVDERDEWQVVELPRAEHPELYALWDEKLWLVQRVNELEFVQED